MTSPDPVAAEPDNEHAWGQWWDIQYDLGLELDKRLDQVSAGRSDQFKAALAASLIEHLGERMRLFLHLPATDSRENPDGT